MSSTGLYVKFETLEGDLIGVNSRGWIAMIPRRYAAVAQVKSSGSTMTHARVILPREGSRIFFGTVVNRANRVMKDWEVLHSRATNYEPCGCKTRNGKCIGKPYCFRAALLAYAASLRMSTL